MVLFFLKWAATVPCLPQKTLGIKNVRQGCPELTSTYLPAVGFLFCFDFEAQPYKYERVREPRLGNTSLVLI